MIEESQPQAVSVNLHAWRNSENGDCEYCDASEETPDGWCIYTRTDFDNEGKAAPFDISDELDFPDYATALAAGLRRFGPVWNRCFLEYAADARGKIEFPRVIMNPPFRDVRKHIAAARSLMGRGGHPVPAVLVALVPITFEADGMETLERLPVDTFATAKVHTKIIRITEG